MTRWRALFPALLSAIAMTPVLASGFGFYEQGGKASGQAGAWVARADDASANWYNPAALVHLSGREVQFGINYVEPAHGTRFDPLGSPGGSIEPVPNSVSPAHLYFSQKINDRVAWGVGFNTPFGLVSEWDDPLLTVSSKRADLRTYLINPNVAFKLGEYWSVAVGADYLTARVREFSRDIVPAMFGANLKGDGDAWGYNLAAQFRAKSFSVAVQHRSEFNSKISGNLILSSPGDVTSLEAVSHLDLPAQTLIGAAWTGARVDVEFDAYATQWSSFKSLDVSLPPDTTPIISIPENWENTWAYRLGLAFRLDPKLEHELRVGGVRDMTPVPDRYRRPSIPDSDRTGYTLGYGYSGKRWGIDFYGMYFDFDDAAADGSVLDGVVNGTYKTAILLAGVTGKYRF